MHIERKRQQNELGDMLSLAVFSLTLPQELGLELDALCSFTGQGEDARVLQPARRYWEDPRSKNRFFLVPGYNKKEKTWKELTLDSLSKEPFSLKRLDGIHVEVHMGTTKDQADWTIAKIKELGIKSCGIVSTPFHLLRSYATTLASMRSAGIRIPIVPVPALVSPGKAIEETNMGAWDMIQGEAERILAYRKKGDVISRDDFRDYIDWLWAQPLLKKYL